MKFWYFFQYVGVNLILKFYMYNKTSRKTTPGEIEIFRKIWRLIRWKDALSLGTLVYYFIEIELWYGFITKSRQENIPSNMQIGNRYKDMSFLTNCTSDFHARINIIFIRRLTIVMNLTI